MSTKAHLVLEDRKQIESMLNQKLSFTKIGKTIGKSTLTVSRGGKSHKIERNQTPYRRKPNRCKNSFIVHGNKGEIDTAYCSFEEASGRRPEGRKLKENAMNNNVIDAMTVDPKGK